MTKKKPKGGIKEVGRAPAFVPGRIVLKETIEIIKVGRRKDGVVTWKLRRVQEPLSPEAREYFRNLDRNPPEKYQQMGARPVPYLYRDPRTKKEGRISIGRMLQNRTLAIRVLDDQTKMALGRGNLFGKGGRTHLNRVRNLAKILGLEERVERAVRPLCSSSSGTRLKSRAGHLHSSG